MRDSQSLFDQLLAFGGERITVQDVHQLLGTAPDDRLLDLVEAFISQQPAAALAQIEAALHEGVQIGSFSDQLLACLRDLLVIAAGAGEAGLSALNESSRSRLEEQARRWGLQTISSAMQILAETKAKMQRVNYGRALLELAIVRMATLEQLDQIAALLQQGTAPASSGAPGAAPAAKVGSADLKKNLSAVLKSPAANSARPVSSANVAVATLPSTAVSEKGDAPDSLPASRVELSSATLPQFWEQMLAAAPETLAGHLKNASQTAISGPNRLEILFPRSYLFSKSYCERTEPLKKLISVAGQLAGQPVEFRFAVDETAAVVARPAPASAPPAVQRRRTSTVDGDPFVQQALAIFGGQVVEVRTIPQAGVVEAAAEGAVEEADDASE
jgi:DNA polymerase-3 subunit gamma/tau